MKQKPKKKTAETPEEIVSRLKNELPDGYRIVNMADAIDFSDDEPCPPEPSAKKPLPPTPSSVPMIEGAWKPFGGLGIFEATRQALVCISDLKYCAASAQFGEVHFHASLLLADVAAHFIKQWPSEVNVQPDIWKIHRDKKSGFRQRWNKLRRSTQAPYPFVRDFAEHVWAVAMINEPERMRQYQSDPKTCWIEVLEPIGRKYWPGWMSQRNIELYHPNKDGEHEALKVPGWVKGKWRDTVRTAIMKLAAEWESSALWFELPTG